MGFSRIPKLRLVPVNHTSCYVSVIDGGFATHGTNVVQEQTVRIWDSRVTTTALISPVNTTTAFSGNDFALDDITFNSTCTAAVPELSIRCIFAVGFALVASGRRRRKHTSNSNYELSKKLDSLEAHNLQKYILHWQKRRDKLMSRISVERFV